MTDIKVGDSKYILVKIDATMTGKKKKKRVRVVLPSGDRIWLDPRMLEEQVSVQNLREEE